MSKASHGRGRFITLEGVDGAGKSTHTTWITEFVRAQGQAVILTREPGGTLLGEKLRTLLLNEEMGVDTETLLMFAARCEHTHQVIEPALAQGTWVICDRYSDATYAYQGGGRRLGVARVATLERWMDARRPDHTWLFDVPLEVARQRLADAREPDRFEREEAVFFQRTREVYLARAAADSTRIHIVDSTQSIAVIRAQLETQLRALLVSQ